LSNEIGMVVDLDIYRAAKIFVKKYGADLAPFMARKRADAMLEFGDTEGQRVWTAVLRAVQELIRTERGLGDRVN
jgi:hypothetical protein